MHSDLEGQVLAALVRHAVDHFVVQTEGFAHGPG